MVFIYWLEDHPAFAARVEALFDDIDVRQGTLCTSILTLGEVLVAPRRHGDFAHIKNVKAYFESPKIKLLPFTLETADMFAEVRADNRVSPADAIHLASAATARVDLFVTNDAALRKLRIPGIKFMAGLDGRVF